MLTVVRIRGWFALIVLFALFLALLYPLVFRGGGSGKPLSVQDLREVAAQAARSPNDVEAQMDAAIGYAGLLGSMAGIEKSAKATLELSFEDSAVDQSPKVQEAKERVRVELAKIRERVGIHSEAELKALITQGLAHCDALLARSDLDTSQRAAAHLARGRLYLSNGQPDLSLRDANASLGMGGDPVISYLLRADSLTDLERYGEAVTDLRKASFAISSWENRPPGWELRLAWAIARPSRPFWRDRQERRWRERRRELGRNLRGTIAAEISVLNSLQMLEEKLGTKERVLRSGQEP